MKKQYAVFGLGKFGHSVAITLENLGCDVIVVDNSAEKVQEIADSVSYAIKADIEDPEIIRSLGVRNLDGAIIGVAENLEASIMATIIAKEMGIPYVLAKAQNELHATILKKVGADAIVFPEKETGSRVAKSLVSTNFADWIELSTDYSLVETEIPKTWVGKTLVELRVREKCGVNVVGIIEDGVVDINMNPNKPMPKKGILILIGPNRSLQNFKKD
ncbi:MAG: TrkA family potassium uptake protein [Lachnospiraceae bacterium]|nr:TrkA family potassium uptake protein [Lachnospiraceae bacterium]